MNRGTISRNGVNMGIASTGIKIAGSADGAYTTTIDGGIFNGGTHYGARPSKRTPIGLQIGSGASTPILVNTGSIAAVTVHRNRSRLPMACASTPARAF